MRRAGNAVWRRAALDAINSATHARGVTALPLARLPKTPGSRKRLRFDDQTASLFLGMTRTAPDSATVPIIAMLESRMPGHSTWSSLQGKNLARIEDPLPYELCAARRKAAAADGVRGMKLSKELRASEDGNASRVRLPSPMSRISLVVRPIGVPIPSQTLPAPAARLSFSHDLYRASILVDPQDPQAEE